MRHPPNSKMLLTSVSLMISPLLRQSFLLSSSTVFMLSIQTASTGPSNMYQRLSSSVAAAPIRINVHRMPSVLSTAYQQVLKVSTVITCLIIIIITNFRSLLIVTVLIKICQIKSVTTADEEW